MWQWVAIFFIGVSVGIVIGVLIDKDTVYTGKLKLKQRGRQNVQAPEIKAEISKRKQRRLDRKEKKG